MAVRTKPAADDDPAFLALVDRILDATLQAVRPMDVFVIRVRNWFDHKWLDFSGRGVVANPGGAALGFESALDEFRKGPSAFPPFTPSRVILQSYYCWTTRSYYQEQPPFDLVHPYRKSRSAKNLHRRTGTFTKSGAFFWYSSNTAKNGRGSLLVYEVLPDASSSWYASFRKDEVWRLTSTKGMDRTSVSAMLPMESR